MKRIIPNIFPLIDYLYIFQVFEYDPSAFFKWFVKHPFARNLQRKHTVVYSAKMALLLAVSFVLVTLAALIVASLFSTIWLAFIFFFLLFQALSPLLIIDAYFLILPLDIYQRQRILSAAKKKVKTLPNLKVVAIVGSFAKTSTKDALYTLLWKNFRVVKTPKSFNTPVSVARTILSDLKPNTEVFIVEMDAYKPGEIRELCNIVKPNIGIVTAIAPQHLERFGSMETLAKTQFELAESVKNGTLVLNSQSEWIRKMSDSYKNQQVFLYGLRDEDDFYASEVHQAPEGLQFLLHAKPFVSQRAKAVGDIDKATAITIPLFGEHHVSNFLGAAAVAMLLGLPLKKIKERAAFLLPTPHRLEVKQSGHFTLIDNSYNSNPTAVQSSLNVLRQYPGSQKILITPGFIELGEAASNANQQFAKDAALFVDDVIVVGENAKEDLLKGLSDGQFPKEKTHVAKSTAEALHMLAHLASPAAVVLIENDLPDQYF